MADDAKRPLDAGTCQVHDAGPMELGDFNPPDGSFSNIAALAVDDDGVYVVTQASEASFTMDRVQIYRVPPCGGSATLLGSRTTPAMTGGTYGALAASQRVFVVMGDGVYSVPTSGGPMTTETTSSVLFNAQVAVYGNQFYWIDSSATLWGLATGGGGVPREQHDGAQQRDTCPIQGKSGDASEEHPEIHEGEDAQDERVHEARVYVTWPPLLFYVASSEVLPLVLLTRTFPGARRRICRVHTAARVGHPRDRNWQRERPCRPRREQRPPVRALRGLEACVGMRRALVEPFRGAFP